MLKNAEYLKTLDIAYVDDDIEISKKVYDLLKYFFRNVYIFNNPKDFLESIKVRNYNLLISDICMPDYSGIELAKIVRITNKKIPIILLTSFMSEKNLFESANLNIQSYIIKPLNLEKLSNAFENIFYFLDVTNNLNFNINDFLFDINTLQLEKNGKEIFLNKKERNSLKLFISNIGKSISYEEIENRIWLVDNEVMSQNALRTVIKTLRKKLDDTTFIRNISGGGYIFEMPKQS